MGNGFWWQLSGISLSIQLLVPFSTLNHMYFHKTSLADVCWSILPSYIGSSCFRMSFSTVWFNCSATAPRNFRQPTLSFQLVKGPYHRVCKFQLLKGLFHPDFCRCSLSEPRGCHSSYVTDEWTKAKADLKCNIMDYTPQLSFSQCPPIGFHIVLKWIETNGSREWFGVAWVPKCCRDVVLANGLKRANI